MGITQLWMILMLVVLQGWWCDGCLEEERIALLQFKASVDHLYPDSLTDWVEGSNCCNWTRVYCNSTTGRVMQLAIIAIRDPKDWYLNTSLFLPLKELSALDLSENGIAGCVENEGFERLLVLNHLEDLNLRDNNLDGSILSSLSALSSLKTLNLANNKIEGSIDIQGGQGLLQLKQLQWLSLSNNHFNNSILLSLKHLSSLEILQLDNNRLKGAIHMEELNALSNLEILYLNRNGIDQFVSSTGGQGVLQLNKLRILDLSKNHFNNSILLSLKHLPSLKCLFLNNNRLEGAIHMEAFDSLSNLEDLFLDGNKITEVVASRGSSFLTSLKTISLRNNTLGGTKFDQGICQFKHLEELDMSYNNLNGELPSCLANLTSLQVLDLSNNHLQGGIPNTLSNCSSLFYLDLSNNSFFGRLPKWIGNISNLQYLSLSQNHFFGTLPHRFNSPLLEILDLSENNIGGSLTKVFYNRSQLSTLDVTHNNFIGEIPKMIELLSNLRFLLLSYNNLEGEIPIELCKLAYLRVIDLSNNKFSGHIQPCILSTTNLQVTSFFMKPISLPLTTKNILYHYRGTILNLLSGIDLSCNNLKGQIPGEFGNLSNIQLLNLSHNSLIGEIPSTFSNLKEIETLDLSFNNLSGSIPPQLTGLNFLSSFSVAHNNLSGRTPERVAQFGTFGEVSYRDNPYLCGPPLPKRCNEDISPPSIPENGVGSEAKDELIDMDAFKATFIASYPMTFLTVCVVLYINPQWRRASFQFVEQKISKCYYFVVDNIPFVSKLGFS